MQVAIVTMQHAQQADAISYTLHVLHCNEVSQLIVVMGQSLQIDDIRAMSASPPTAVELMRRREQ